MVMLTEVMVTAKAAPTVIAVARAMVVVEVMVIPMAVRLATTIDLKAEVVVTWAFCHDDAWGASESLSSSPFSYLD